MTTEELMRPRYKVIAGFPGNPYEVGEILVKYEYGNGNYCYSLPKGAVRTVKEEIESYPHLFKPLEWWEERKEDEMPEYVKTVWEGKLLGVWKIIRWDLEEGRGYINDYQVISLGFKATEPATQAEYDATRTGSTSE